MTSGCETNGTILFRPEDFDGGLFLQLSRGNIEYVDNDTFSDEDGRTTPWMTGIPPESPPPPAGGPPGKEGEIMLWMEK